VTGVVFPDGYRLEGLQRGHGRKKFDCGQSVVNDWLRTRALQQQSKRLSVTKVLLDEQSLIAGFYTLATGQVDFGDLPADIARHLPRRALPVAIVAWLGIDRRHQGRQLGDRLFAQALRDCCLAGETFAFVAVVLDCVDDRAKAFYHRWDFREVPGNLYRLLLSAQRLESILLGR
jgi:GNAT superfamily N-acetyltransferase